VAHDITTGEALLYAAAPRTTEMATDKIGGKYTLFSSDPSDLKVSADGGVTWTSAPSAGIPANLTPFYDVGLLGVLSDGSVVVDYVAQAAHENFSSGVLYAWKPGATAWRQLAPPLTSEAGALTPFASSSTSPGANTLYLVMVDRAGSGPGARPTYTFLRYDP
jgi:hypothetical protein